MGKVKRRVNDSVTNRPRGSVLTWGSLEIKMNLLTFKSESCLEVTPPCDCALVKQSGYFKRMHKFVITFLEIMSTIAIKVVQLFFQWTYRGSIGARSFVSRMPRGTWEHTEGISNAARACSWGGSRGSAGRLLRQLSTYNVWIVYTGHAKYFSYFQSICLYKWQHAASLNS